MGVTWFFFMANIFIMQIVLLNFLIAEVSRTYERVKDIGPCLMYQKKQELNFFVQKILRMYGKEDPFKALIFVTPTDYPEEQDENSLELLQTFREDLKKNMNKVRTEFKEGHTKVQNMFQQSDVKFHKFQEQVKNLLKEQSQMLMELSVNVGLPVQGVAGQQPQSPSPVRLQTSA